MGRVPGSLARGVADIVALPSVLTRCVISTASIASLPRSSVKMKNKANPEPYIKFCLRTRIVPDKITWRASEISCGPAETFSFTVEKPPVEME